MSEKSQENTADQQWCVDGCSPDSVTRLINHLEGLESCQSEMLQEFRNLPDFENSADSLEQLLEKINATSSSLDELREKLSTADQSEQIDSGSNESPSDFCSALSIFNAISDGVVKFSKGKAVFANRLATELLTCSESATLEQIEISATELGLLDMSDEAGCADGRLELKSPSGRYLSITIQDDSQHADDFVLIIEDRTERIAGAKAKSDFIAAISHELRTPVTCIRNSVSNILAGVTGKISQKTRSYLESVRSDCHRFSNLVGDLLDVSKLETGAMPINRTVTRLDIVVANCVEGMKHLAREKGIGLGLSKADCCYTMHADSQRLKQALGNLLDNAVKFTDEGDVSVALEETPDNFIVSIKDTGIGIPESLKARVFENFYQIGRQAGAGYKGAGLGLPVSKGIVEAHGGRIFCESIEGEGATFSVTLPKSNPATLLQKRILELKEQVVHSGDSITLILLSPPSELDRNSGPGWDQLRGAVSKSFCDTEFGFDLPNGEMFVLSCENRSKGKRFEEIKKIVRQQSRICFGGDQFLPMVGLGRYPGNAAGTEHLETAARDNLTRMR